MSTLLGTLEGHPDPPPPPLSEPRGREAGPPLMPTEGGLADQGLGWDPHPGRPPHRTHHYPRFSHERALLEPGPLCEAASPSHPEKQSVQPFRALKGNLVIKVGHTGLSPRPSPASPGQVHAKEGASCSSSGGKGLDLGEADWGHNLGTLLTVGALRPGPSSLFASLFPSDNHQEKRKQVTPHEDRDNAGPVCHWLFHGQPRARPKGALAMSSCPVHDCPSLGC